MQKKERDVVVFIQSKEINIILVSGDGFTQTKLLKIIKMANVITAMKKESQPNFQKMDGRILLEIAVI